VLQVAQEQVSKLVLELREQRGRCAPSSARREITSERLARFTPEVVRRRLAEVYDAIEAGLP